MDKKEKATIYDISEKCGVSIATVSRVLNNSDKVTEATREKVLKVMEEMGYKPNGFARGLSLDSMKTIGILCADSSDTYLAKAVYFIEEQLRHNHYNTLLCCTGYEHEAKEKALDLLLSKKVDAAILVGSHFLEESDEDNMYIKKAAEYIPIMLLNGHSNHPNVYSVSCDDYSAMKCSADYLLDQGRNSILYLYNSRTYSGLNKLNGFVSALKERKLPVKNELFHYCGMGRNDVAGFLASLEDLYSKGVHFDAIVADEDIVAVAAVKFAVNHGLSVPKDLSIIGYNNSLLATVTAPELTSIDNRLEPMCHHLVDTLLNVLQGAEMPNITEFKGELVIRETT